MKALLSLFAYLTKIKTIPILIVFTLSFNVFSQSDVICIDQNKLTADTSYSNYILYQAIEYKLPTIINKFIESGITIPVNYQSSVLKVIYEKCDCDISSYLDLYPLRKNTLEGYYHLMKTAVQKNDLRTIKYLYSAGYPIHKPDFNTNKKPTNTKEYNKLEIYRLPSPLEFITWKNEESLLDSILALGENIDGLFPIGDPPIFIALKNHEIKTVQKLLAKGARTDVESYCNGITISQLLDWQENDILQIRNLIKSNHHNESDK